MAHIDAENDMPLTWMERSEEWLREHYHVRFALKCFAYLLLAAAIAAIFAFVPGAPAIPLLASLSAVENFFSMLAVLMAPVLALFTKHVYTRSTCYVGIVDMNNVDNTKYTEAEDIYLDRFKGLGKSTHAQLAPVIPIATPADSIPQRVNRTYSYQSDDGQSLTHFPATNEYQSQSPPSISRAPC